MKMNSAHEYTRHYKEFSQNVAFAARTWHHYLHLQNRAAENNDLLEALNKAPRFWLDARYSSVQTTIIFLGKIFDTDQRSFNVDKTMRSVHDGREHFSTPQLRKRKTELNGEFDGLDLYMQSTSELSDDDVKSIAGQIRAAKEIWERIKPLRDKIYAHNEILTDKERDALFKAVKNEDITGILQTLLNVSEALWQAEHNGRKPDFSKDFTAPISNAHKDIEALIGSLLQQQ